MTAVRSGSTITKSAFEPLLITPLSGYRLNRLALLVAQTPRRRSIPIRLRLYPSVSSIGSINSMPGWRSGGAFPHTLAVFALAELAALLTGRDVVGTDVLYRPLRSPFQSRFWLRSL